VSKRLRLALIALALVAAPSTEAADLVFFGKSRPVRVQLAIDLGKQSPQAGRDRYLQELFALLDRDADGTLSALEASRAPDGSALTAQFGQQRTSYLAPAASARLQELDQDGDGRVSLDEFLAYYRRAGLHAVRAHHDESGSRRGDVLTAVLFRALDADGDGKISQVEAGRAAESLARFDLDDDELITREELLGRNPAAALADPEPAGAPVLLLSSEEAGGREHLARRLLEHFGRDKGDKLRFLDLPPDLVITLRRDGIMAGERTSLPVRQIKDRTLVDLEGTTLELVRGVDELAAPAARTFFEHQFRAASSGTGFLHEKDLDKPQYRFFKPVLRIADRNGDGKLSASEFAAWLELQDKGRSFVGVSIRQEGRDLFGLLDSTRQNRLSPRDLLGVWARLAPFANGKDAVTLASLPRTLRLSFTLGWSNTAPTSGATTEAPPARRGPEWFQKMDRNGDGDVSPREWLGSPARFQELDRNGDGLIDPDEAAAAPKRK
jgi:Ca2+-binding EF-hand superfamily protein